MGEIRNKVYGKGENESFFLSLDLDFDLDKKSKRNGCVDNDMMEFVKKQNEVVNFEIVDLKRKLEIIFEEKEVEY